MRDNLAEKRQLSAYFWRLFLSLQIIISQVLLEYLHCERKKCCQNRYFHLCLFLVFFSSFPLRRLFCSAKSDSGDYLADDRQSESLNWCEKTAHLLRYKNASSKRPAEGAMGTTSTCINYWSRRWKKNFLLFGKFSNSWEGDFLNLAFCK